MSLFRPPPFLPSYTAPRVRRILPTLDVRTVQFARPATDVAMGDWQTSEGHGTLAAYIGDTYPNDSSFIVARAPSGVAKVNLSPVTDPVSSAGHVLRYRAKSPYAQQAKFGLYQGSTLIAEWTDTLTTSLADYSHTLSGAQADAITDYALLQLWITGVVPT